MIKTSRLLFRNLNYCLKTRRHFSVPSRNALKFQNSPNYLGCLTRLKSQFPTSKIKAKQIKNIQDLFMYIDQGNQFYLRLLSNIFNTINFDNLKEEEILLLLQCCGKSVADSSKKQRNEICQQLFLQVQNSNNITLNIYNSYITICTENGIELNLPQFLSSMKCKPDKLTAKLLLKNSAMNGNVSQNLTVLELMKQNSWTLDQDIFHTLLLGHVLKGGLNEGQNVLTTMKIAQLTETAETKMSILKALALRNDLNEFSNYLKKNPFDLTQNQLLELVEIIGLKGNEKWLQEKPFNQTKITREMIPQLEQICIHLIHENQPKAAFDIYLHFKEPSLEENYAYFLLKEMLHCYIPIETITELGLKLKTSNLNLSILENITELALRHGYKNSALYLFKHLPFIRPHYFWPLLVNVSKTGGEIELLNFLKVIHEDFKLKPDYDTLEMFVYPFCNLKNFKVLLNNLQNYGLTIREMLSPLLVVLLNTKEFKLALEAVKTYNVELTGERIIYLLGKNWLQFKNSDLTFMLQKYCESNPNSTETTGEFILNCIGSCKSKGDYHKLSLLMKELKAARLRISLVYEERLQKIIIDLIEDKSVSNDLLDGISALVDLSLKSEEVSIPHPRNMNLDQLECHLVELEEKQMDTRGILRKLIQLHSNMSNFPRVEELREKFISKGYSESIGMKSALFHNYVTSGNLTKSEELFNDIKTHSNFQLDHYKIIDYSALLIRNERAEEGIALLEKELSSKKNVNMKSIERNCKELLLSCKNEQNQLQVFHILLKYNFCNPTNNILGAFMRLYLNKKNINEIVGKFTELCEKYKCTPLQLEVVMEVVKSNDEKLLGKTLNAIQKVHGIQGANTALIAALAETNSTKLLEKFLLDINVPMRDYLRNRCERWVKENKLEPLKSLQKCSKRLSPEILDQKHLYSCIFDLYYQNNDLTSAMDFWEEAKSSLNEDQIQDLQNVFDAIARKFPKSSKIRL